MQGTRLLWCPNSNPISLSVGYQDLSELEEVQSKAQVERDDARRQWEGG